MTTQEVANRLVSLCKEGQWEKVQQELYAKDAWSIEPKGAMNEQVQGMDAIRKKGEEWDNMVEAVHSSEISDPLVAENFFSVSMKMNITMKGAPGPMQMDEICVYEVREGKIVKEQFFYTPEPQMA